MHAAQQYWGGGVLVEGREGGGGGHRKAASQGESQLQGRGLRATSAVPKGTPQHSVSMRNDTCSWRLEI